RLCVGMSRERPGKSGSACHAKPRPCHPSRSDAFDESSDASHGFFTKAGFVCSGLVGDSRCRGCSVLRNDPGRPIRKLISPILAAAAVLCMSLALFAIARKTQIRASRIAAICLLTAVVRTGDSHRLQFPFVEILWTVSLCLSCFTRTSHALAN